MMFISSKTHDLIVNEMRATAIGAMAARDAIIAELRSQIAKLEEAHDWYRKEWTKERGKAFRRRDEPEPQSMPLFDQAPTPSPPLDADWNEDERALFQDWAVDFPKDMNPEEEYRRAFGTTSPLLTLTA